MKRGSSIYGETEGGIEINGGGEEGSHLQGRRDRLEKKWSTTDATGPDWILEGKLKGTLESGTFMQRIEKY